MIKRAKHAHYESVLSSLDMRTCFRVVITLLKPPGTILQESSNTEALCNDFATYFAEKTRGIRMQIRTMLTNDEDCSDYGIDSDSQRLSSELDRLLPTSEDEIKNIIRLCPPKTCSLDSCPPDLLKKTVGVHVPYLVAIVNNSFKQGLFPVTLRTGIVKPLLKSDTLDKDLLKNYRPVSNIAFVGKVLVKVAVRRVLDHLTLNGLHEEYQSAYKMLHSTETALLRVQHDIASELDKNHASSIGVQLTTLLWCHSHVTSGHLTSGHFYFWFSFPTADWFMTTSGLPCWTLIGCCISTLLPVYFPDR